MGDAHADAKVQAFAQASAPVWSIQTMPAGPDGGFRILACAGGGQAEVPNTLVSRGEEGRREGSLLLLCCCDGDDHR